MKSTLSLLLAALLLGGCQSQPPVPADRYYRLPESTSAAPESRPWTNGHIVVRELRANGPYLDRAVLYSEAERPTQLQPYHYHHWIYPPSQLIQQHLVPALSRAGLSPSVSDGDTGPRPQWVVSGKIIRFERLVAASHANAVVELELQLARANGQPLVRQVYRAEAKTDSAMDGFAGAMQQALAQVYGEFVRDIRLQKAE